MRYITFGGCKSKLQHYVPGNKHKHNISKWITHGIIKSIKYRDKLNKMLKMIHHESPNFTILTINLKAFNNTLKKLYVQPNIYNMSLLLVEIRPILETHENQFPTFLGMAKKK